MSVFTNVSEEPGAYIFRAGVPEDGSNRFLQKVYNHLRDYTMST
jgi:hypothetical protein